MSSVRTRSQPRSEDTNVGMLAIGNLLEPLTQYELPAAIELMVEMKRLEPTLSLPISPHDARNLPLLITSFNDSKNASSEKR